MDEKKGLRLLSKRNVLGGLLIAGIAIGLYLGDLWNGFGGGNSLGVGQGDGKSTSEAKNEAENSETSTTVVQATAPIKPDRPAQIPGQPLPVVKAVLDERTYFVRSDTGDVATDLEQLVQLAKRATGDDYGVKIRIYRRPKSLPATELALQDALVEAGLNEDQIVWIGNPIDD